MAEASKLRLNQNGWIVVETRGTNFVRQSVARDLTFYVQHKMQNGEWQTFGTFEDDYTARQCLCESKYKSRLVAGHECGKIALPSNWKGRC